jgi:hypothetical protein
VFQSPTELTNAIERQQPPTRCALPKDLLESRQRTWSKRQMQAAPHNQHGAPANSG